MAAISDAVVIGTVLALLLAAVSYYLYSRLGQLERKVGLMENILLDLKVQTEQTLHATYPADEAAPVEESFEPALANSLSSGTTLEELQGSESAQPSQESLTAEAIPKAFTPFAEVEEGSTPDVRSFLVDANPLKTRTPTVQVQREPATPVAKGVEVNYSAHTYKELLAIAKQKNVTGGSHMTKTQLIDALKRKDAGLSEIPADSSSLTQSFELGSAEEHLNAMEEVDPHASLVELS